MLASSLRNVALSFLFSLASSRIIDGSPGIPTLKEDQDWSSMSASWTSPTSGYAAMPLGNGRMGVKVNGGVATETYQLNDNEFWSGDPQLQLQFNNGTWPGTVQPNTNASVRYAAYVETRETILSAYRQNISATDRSAAILAADQEALKMWGAVSADAVFLPVGNLLINVAGTSGYSNYTRTLDLDGARTIVSYRVGTTIYTRESFTSYPDEVLAVRMKSSDGTVINATISLALPSQMAQALYPDGTNVAENNVKADFTTGEIVMTGRAPLFKGQDVGKPDEWSPTRGITVEARVKVIVGNNGTTNLGNGSVEIRSSDFTLIYRSKTSYVDPFTDPSGPDAAVPSEVVRRSIDNAVQKGYLRLLQDHQVDFRNEFRRLWINLGGETITTLTGSEVPPTAYALHLQYTRYQTLCASRANIADRPNALQAIWSSDWSPESDGSYFLNENVEKMYAAIEVQNLASTGDPLWKWLRNLSINGKATAAGDWGMDDGSWTTGHYSDIWVTTALKGSRNTWNILQNEATIWPHGGIWLMNQLYDSYSFSQNITFLWENYDLIEGAAKFAFNQLTSAEGVNGELKQYLSIPVSTSPEQEFLIDGNERAIDINTACDNEIFRNIFAILGEASTILTSHDYHVDTNFVAKVTNASSYLVPLGSYIAPNGSFLEYHNEYPVWQTQHRHASHLIMVFPLHYTEFGQRTTPNLYAAAQKAWIDRGGAANAWHPDGTTAGVRLGFASEAMQNIKQGIFNAGTVVDYQQWGAMGSCIGEALIDSTNGEINILPYVPSEWTSGSFIGARARGGYEVSFSWKDGALTCAEIDSKNGGTPAVRYNGTIVDLEHDPRFTLLHH